MVYKFDEDKPIYKQFFDQLKLEIITDKYKPGDRLPSVRDFSIDTKVNPNTVQRALLELENENLIITKRTLGKFITDNDKVIKKYKKEYVETIIDDFIGNINKLEITDEEIIQIINENRKGK